MLPMIALFLIAEIILHKTPNTFNQKAKYLNQNKNNIEVLFLGSSHTQNGINPAFMNLNSSNLGYGNQDYQIDLAILNSYIDQLPNLKYIIEEVDFIDLYKKRDSTYFRYPWYEKYYGFKLGSYPKYKKWSLYLSNPDFFNNYFKNYFFDENNINLYGYDDVEVQGEFYRQDYNKNKIEISTIGLPEFELLNDKNKKSLKTNLKRLKLIESLALKKNIKFIKVSYPMFITYYKNLESYKTYNIWKNYISNEQKNGKLFWNFERNGNFRVSDFANGSHLNNGGAKKLTQMINDSINKLESENN